VLFCGGNAEIDTLTSVVGQFVDSAGWQRLLFIWPWLLPISMIIGAFAGGAFMMKDMSVSDTGEKIEAEG
jgi:hypothetical protein